MLRCCGVEIGEDEKWGKRLRELIGYEEESERWKDGKREDRTR